MSVTYAGALTIPELFPPTDQLTTLVKTAITGVNAYVKAVNSFNKSLTDVHKMLDVVVADVHKTLDVVADVLITIEGGLDFVLNAQFGLIPLKRSAVLEFQGALKAMANLSIAISNPLANAMASLTAMATAMASLKASLALGMPTISAELGLQLSALASVQAAAAAKMAGIQAVITAMGSFLGPLFHAKELIATLKTSLTTSLMTSLMTSLTTSLTTSLMASLTLPLPTFELDTLGNILVALTTHLQGPGVYVYSGDVLYSDLQGALGNPPAGLTPTTALKAVVLLVDEGTSPSTWVNLKFMMRTTP